MRKYLEGKEQLSSKNIGTRGNVQFCTLFPLTVPPEPHHPLPPEDSDVTEIMWEPALRHGGGLEPQGHVVGVRETGMYLLYSQVLFHDVTFTMGQVVYREGQGREILSRCVCSMPSELHQAYNSCYTAGVFQLYQGDILNLIVPRAGAKLDLTPHGFA
ncbi:tumor necrosis factor ligand superfamily member 13 isoform X6 [Gracilinanus agilis]|uniref:tumor necrosis factor ligand superfamily member 13 isoform X6 n=1 Tax=Gracilinanus agilis TaxID=191870 RepID=UPI001CFEDC43|nr:tumor necrosis factor ligand superfamily member 13 isoform X6 [Gracilinanus agilis]